MIKISLKALLVAMVFVPLARADFLSYVDITVAGHVNADNEPLSELENFPVLVRISETGIRGFSYSQIQADAKDLAFTSTDGDVIYPHEIDTWNTSGESLVWVLLPKMQNGTTFRMMWGDETITEVPGYTTDGKMWTDAGYIGVWHLNEKDPEDWVVGSGSAAGIVGYSYDSTANKLHGKNNVESSHIENGAVGAARNMSEKRKISVDGKSTYQTKNGGVSVPGYGDHHTNTLTASVWLMHKASVNYDALLCTKSGFTGSVDGWGFGTGNGYTGYAYGNGTGKCTYSLPGTANSSTWEKFDIAIKSGTKWKTYKNGLFSEEFGGVLYFKNSNFDLGIGSSPYGGGNAWGGYMDEVRIRKGESSADWVAADFATIKDPNFLSYGSTISSESFLIVAGDPDNWGTAIPAYGNYFDVKSGDEFTASVTATNVVESGVERWICTGYTHYKIINQALGTKIVSQQGTDSSFLYKQVAQDELVWHFTNEWLVNVTVIGSGRVSTDSEWVLNGKELSLVAEADDGYELWGWDIDMDGIADIRDTNLIIPVTKALSLRAVFAPVGTDPSVQYVAKGGDDSNHGYSDSLPKATVAAAVASLDATIGQGTVYVDYGTYELLEVLVVSNAISIVGRTGKPEDIILKHKPNGNKDHNMVELNHPEALVSSLTIEGGVRSSGNSGVGNGNNLAILSKGGSATNCIIRNGYSAQNYSVGVGVYMDSEAALVTHCVITNNISTTYLSYERAGVGVHMKAGRLSNSLIAGNKNRSTALGTRDRDYFSVGGVFAIGSSRVENCTIVGCVGRQCGGLWIGDTATAINTVIAGNNVFLDGNEYTLQYASNNVSRLINRASYCATDDEEAINELCIAGNTTDFFVDFDKQDYRIKGGGSLYNAGIVYDGISAVDLLGKPRVIGKAPDIGAYESKNTSLLIYIR